MKIVIAQMKHETNTFSPVPTPLARFGRGGLGPLEGDAALTAFRGTGTGIGAMIDAASAAGAEIVLPIAANAAPSAPCSDATYEHIVERICDAVAAGCDAVLLDLHGAMVTESLEDGEGELLRRLRKIAPRVPIGLALDMHTNLYPAIAEHASVIAGYQTYPHVDMYETGMRASRPIFAMLAGRSNPVIAWGQRPMIPHVMRQASDDLPNRVLQSRARAMEREGALAASLFVGFPHADISQAGLSAVVVTDGDPALARRLCDELLDAAWAARSDFIYRLEPLDDSLARARQLSASAPGSGPIVLLDHYDNCASGGTMDTMTVLERIIDAGLDQVAAFAICDPWAVQQMIAAGVGASLTLPLGGKLDMPAIGRPGRPLTLTGRVKRVSEGVYLNLGPMARGERTDMGASVVFDTGRVEIAVISRHVEPHDIACLQTLGIDPSEKAFLMLKSRIHWRAGLKQVARAVVECAGEGVCTSDYSALKFERLRRPIYPLDPLH